jgi:hypothetical protein
VGLDITDVTGRLVATLVDGYLGDGEHQAEWDGRASNGTPVAGGVYFSTVTARGFSETRKVLLLMWNGRRQADYCGHPVRQRGVPFSIWWKRCSPGAVFAAVVWMNTEHSTLNIAS